MIHLQAVCTIIEILDFFAKVFPRQFNYERKKHLISAPTTKAAKLEAPSTAKDKLLKAIPHPKISEQLFYWDNDFNSVLVFQYENTKVDGNYSYHGYHLPEEQFVREYNSTKYRINTHEFVALLKNISNPTN